ncbi:phage integrase N-terminal SAM-like domain-containing protein [Bradyrhizobium icense]|uniref:Integrase n=1 Tax=Bradyrhizobium icense TaxID=1274631 RepID=A0A1B1UDA7_9BRAD|nr:phage integrase N-terminal SAM-like domain-containing protein [Bradyrhizobium icense]ANW00744.1 integrase [Bradyrhizobium icense]
MTDEAMSPLRRRMIEHMTIRKLAPKTQHDYVQRIKNFAAFLGRSPDTASFEDVRRYQLHLAASGVGVPTLNQTVSTLRFFFRVTLRRHEIVELEHTHVIHEPRKLPVVLSAEEVARLLDAAPGLKYKAALSVAYGAGLRATEVVSLKVSDIDSKRMIIRVEQGKGGQEHSNPHSACRTASRPSSAVSSLGGFRTPAAEHAAPSLKRPASETLHNSRHRAGPLRQLIIAGNTQTVRSAFSVTGSLDARNGELASRADYAGRVDLHLERRTGLGRANALYLD